MRNIVAKRLTFIAFLFFGVSTLIVTYLRFIPLPYSFFIEFDNSHGIIGGTIIRMRGVQIGSVQRVKLKLNCVIALAKINSSQILIPTDSVIETTQTGLLNEPIIDIMPLRSIEFKKEKILWNPVSKYCSSFSLICPKAYIKGDRGLNYDDLVRSTTRISQRFDDPRFFNLFYVFLQNGIELTDILLDFIFTVLDTASVSHIYLKHFLSDNMFERSL